MPRSSSYAAAPLSPSSGSGARCSPHLSVGQVDAPADLQAVLSGQVHAKEELILQLQSAAWYKVNASSCRLGPTTRRPAAGQSAAGTGSRAHLQRMEGRQIVVTSLLDFKKCLFFFKKKEKRKTME